jgi:hypothetical protein
MFNSWMLEIGMGNPIYKWMISVPILGNLQFCHLRLVLVTIPNMGRTGVNAVAAIDLRTSAAAFGGNKLPLEPWVKQMCSVDFA